MQRRRRLAWWVGVAACLAAGIWLVANRSSNRTFLAYFRTNSESATSEPLHSRNLRPHQPRGTSPCSGRPEADRLFSPARYFPEGALDCDPKNDTFRTNWYTQQLKALEEPSLWALSRRSSHATVYRFPWLRSFHHPVSVRLIIEHDLTGKLVTKITGGAGGYEPGSLIRNESKPVGKQLTTHFLSQIVLNHYWELERYSQPAGFDGAQWILESVNDGHYQIVDRWSPPETDPIRILGSILMTDLAGIQTDPREVY